MQHNIFQTVYFRFVLLSLIAITVSILSLCIANYSTDCYFVFSCPVLTKTSFPIIWLSIFSCIGLSIYSTQGSQAHTLLWAQMLLMTIFPIITFDIMSYSIAILWLFLLIMITVDICDTIGKANKAALISQLICLHWYMLLTSLLVAYFVTKS